MCQTCSAEQGTKEKAMGGGGELCSRRARERDKLCGWEAMDIYGVGELKNREGKENGSGWVVGYI